MQNHSKLFQVMVIILCIIELILMAGVSYQQHRPFMEVVHDNLTLVLITIGGFLIVTFVRRRYIASDYIRKIEELDWSKADPYEIIYLSRASAIEFADSLHGVEGLIFAKNPLVESMMRGELNTDNLQFDDYHARGDHWQFLDYFCKKLDINKKVSRNIVITGDVYRRFCNNLSPLQRFETIISREDALPDIFQKILESHNWEELGLGFYAYYLQRHIELDSAEGGHGDLLRALNMKPSNKTLNMFWRMRYVFYKELFPKEITPTTPFMNHYPHHI